MKKSYQRRSLFIDRPVQVALLLRAMLYWAVCLMAQLLMVFLFAILTPSQDDFSANGPQMWWHLQLSVIAAAVLLPVLLLDLLRLSHRWVGPVFRLRTTLHALSRGERVPPIRFRDGDFWQELAGDLNVVASELDRQEPALSEVSVANGSLAAANTLAKLRGPESSPAQAAI